MLEKLDARYDSHTTASKITKISEIVSLRFRGGSADISKHIDKLASLLEQLEAMKAKIDDALAIGILFTSIEVPELVEVIAAVKTLSEDNLKWENVYQRLIEEWRSRRSPNSTSVRVHAKVAKGDLACDFCSRRGHKADYCWIYPENPKTRLDSLRNGRKNGDKSKNKKNSKRRLVPWHALSIKT